MIKKNGSIYIGSKMLKLQNEDQIQAGSKQDQFKTRAYSYIYRGSNTKRINN